MNFFKGPTSHLLEIKAVKKDYPLRNLKTVRIFGVKQIIKSIMINDSGHKEFEQNSETNELLINKLNIKLDQDSINRIKININ